MQDKCKSKWCTSHHPSRLIRICPHHVTAINVPTHMSARYFRSCNIDSQRIKYSKGSHSSSYRTWRQGSAADCCSAPKHRHLRVYQQPVYVLVKCEPDIKIIRWHTVVIKLSPPVLSELLSHHIPPPSPRDWMYCAF